MSKTRRDFLKTVTSGSLAFSTPYFWSRSSKASSKALTFGFNIPKTGAYAADGAEQLRGLELAVKHLNGEGNGGLLNTMKPLSLKGNGVLGRKVEFVLGDTQTNVEKAVKSAEKMIRDDKVSMITGGAASDVAIAVQNLCHKEKVIFMVGLSHSNDTTGKDRRKYGFRYFFNAHMSAQALKSIMKEKLGSDRRVALISADYTWGWTLEQSMKAVSDELGWETLSKIRTPLGYDDFAPFLETALKGDPDVLILNHYGGDMVRSLTQAAEMGLREKVVNGKDFQIIVPLFSRLPARTAETFTQGILGTVNWHWTLQDEGTRMFTRSFLQAYGEPPSQAAHCCYVQTLLYANACEHAGTIYAPAVIDVLEGLEFDGMGLGQTLYRAEDHQCFKDVLVVEGSQTPPSPFDLLNIVKTVPVRDVSYPAELFKGELGEV